MPRLVYGRLPDELGHPLDRQACPIGDTLVGIGRDEAPQGRQVAQSRAVGCPHYIAQVVSVASDPESGIAICRAHNYLPAAGLAAGRGHGLCRGYDKQNVIGPAARRALLGRARHNPDRGINTYLEPTPVLL